MIGNIIFWVAVTFLGSATVYCFGSKLVYKRSAIVVPSTPETEDGHVRVKVSWVERGVEYWIFYEGVYEAVKNVDTGAWLIWGDEKMVDRAIWRHSREMRAGGRES